MPLRSLLVAAVTAATLLATSAPALAVPPANDNYLASDAFNVPPAGLGRTTTVTADTTDATTQGDLFNPGPQGEVLGGYIPEPTQCGTTTFGKTVWWDFFPKVDGGVEFNTSGFDNVVAVYEWDPANSHIVANLGCQDASTGLTERFDLVNEVKAGHAYTVQVGGVSAPAGIAGGPLQVELDFFADRDGDGFYDDEGDKCRTTPGPRRFGGCPPQLTSSPISVTPLIGFDHLPGVGVRIQSLSLTNVPKGARITARCRGCRTVRTTARHSTVQFKSLVGRIVDKGTKIQVQVTLGRKGKGILKYGATGALFTWPVINGTLKPRVTQCLHVGTTKIEKCR